MKLGGWFASRQRKEARTEAQRAAEGGRRRGRVREGIAGCKPHKVILQNVYAKRFRTR